MALMSTLGFNSSFLGYLELLKLGCLTWLPRLEAELLSSGQWHMSLILQKTDLVSPLS